MGRLVEHAQERHAPADGQLLRYDDGQPITSRRYDHLWTRIGRHLPWVATQGISSHWIRHIVFALFPCRDTAVGGQADLRPALFDSLLLAAACRPTRIIQRKSNVSHHGEVTATVVATPGLVLGCL